MRKLNLIVSLLAITFLFSSCKKDIDKLLTFHLTDEHTFVGKASKISNAPLNFPFELPPEVITRDAQKDFSAQGTAAHLVKDVSLEKLTLTLVSPSGKDLGFLKSMSVHFADLDDTNNQVIAKIDNVPAGVGNTLELESTNRKLDRYLKSGNFKVSAVVVLDEVVTEDLELKADYRFKVTADPL